MTCGQHLLSCDPDDPVLVGGKCKTLIRLFLSHFLIFPFLSMSHNAHDRLAHWYRFVTYNKHILAVQAQKLFTKNNI